MIIFITTLCPLIASALLTAMPFSDFKASPADIEFFKRKVRPLLIDMCVRCHGAEKQKSDLRLDTVAGIRKGGASGEALVVPTKPETSLLLRVVKHAEGVSNMPPEGKLTDSEIADLTNWIKRGAPFPATVNPEPNPSSHWSFRAVRIPALPNVKNVKWSASDLDRFILAKLESAGLKPATLADKRTLIRRATFDLTGLPPTPEDVEAFLKDQSPNAFAKVVDRLLASPAYGERWGRHWLDVARYADSNGLDENVAHGNAWRYRDYVIKSFNDDKPYDRFLTEQIAGDLLPSSNPNKRNELLIATGFLALGPKVLAEPDEKKMELDIVDEQVDTLGRTMLGLTLGCARCHDHKFDPISIHDYYGLAGVFASTKTMEHFKKVAKWHENSLATAEESEKIAEYEAQTVKLKAYIKELTGKADEASKAELKKRQAELVDRDKNAPVLPSAMGATEGTPTDIPLLRRGNHLTPGALVARRFPIILAGEKQPPLPKDASGRFELANWIASTENPLTARVIVNRVWRWHFGSGLVRSVDNFGLLGEKPSHPELLDWLASHFVKDGWSLKKLHRRIMLSSTYQMSGTDNPKAALIDPENRLLWRANIRRLEAEAIRDSLLAVSGLLDRKPGGPALTHVNNRGYLFDHTSKDLTTYTSDRRSVYLPVIRNNLYDVFQLFDAPDAAVLNGDRSTTTVATQSLFFMNSPLAMRSSDALTDRVFEIAKLSDSERVHSLFALALGREPEPEEIERILSAIRTFEKEFSDAGSDPVTRQRKSWSAVCQAVLASSEFIYIK